LLHLKSLYYIKIFILCFLSIERLVRWSTICSRSLSLAGPKIGNIDLTGFTFYKVKNEFQFLCYEMTRYYKIVL